MFHILIQLLVFFFLASCSDNVIEIAEDLSSATNISSSSANAPSSSTATDAYSSSSYEDTPLIDANVRIGGDLFVHAIDAIYGNPISDAEFFLPAVDSTLRKSSGTNGTVYRNLPIGDNYAISVFAANYTSVTCNSAIKLAENQSGMVTPIVENTSLSISLRKLSSSLRGSIFYQSKGNPHQLDLSPASGAEVLVIIQDETNCSYGQKVFGPVSVNSEGFYSFDSLPEKANYTLIARDATLGGLSYSGMQTSGTLDISGNATILPRMVYDVAQTAFGFVFSSDNRSTAEKGDSLKFGFSEPVNTSMLRNGDLSVSKTDANRTPVAVNFIWSNLDKNLIIVPAFGEWETSQSYAIRMKLYSSLSSKVIDTTLVFLVNEFFDMSKVLVSGIMLDNPAVNYNTGSIVLRWDGIANAEAYEIYAKLSSRFEIIYSLVGEVTTKTGGIVNTHFTLQTGNWFVNNDSAQILIVARNSKGKSAFGIPIVIKDNIQPQFAEGPYAIASDTANYRINATNAFNNTIAASTIIHNVYFSEPMDTTTTLSVVIPSQTPRPLSIEQAWSGQTMLRITFAIAAGELNTNVEPLKIPVTVSGFRDLAGNPIRESTAGTKTWQELLILLHADGVEVQE